MTSVTFHTSLGGDGSTVTDDANATTGLGNGGHRYRFVPALYNTVKIADTVVNNVQAAINSPLSLQATSVTSMTPGTGSKSFTLQQTGKGFFVNGYVLIVNSASTSEFMLGQVTAFNASTGAITVNVTRAAGGTTANAWIISAAQPSLSLYKTNPVYALSGLHFNGYRTLIGDVPSGEWSSNSDDAIEFSSGGEVTSSWTTNGLSLNSNTFYRASGTIGWMAKVTGAALKYTQTGGSHLWYRAQSVTGGSLQNFQRQVELDRYNLTIDSLVNIGRGGSNQAPICYTNNAWMDETYVWKKAAYGAAASYMQDQGLHYWYTDGVTNSGGSAITWTQVMQTFGQYLLIGYTGSNGSYRLQVNSQIFATSSTIATSDANYKKDVVALDGMLDVVNALRPVEFNWKQHPVHNFDTSTKTIGFLAQEVQQVLADKPYVNAVVKSNQCEIEPAVYEVVDGEKQLVKEAVVEPFLGIAEGNMIAILTRALQELNAKVDAQAARIAALEART